MKKRAPVPSSSTRSAGSGAGKGAPSPPQPGPVFSPDDALTSQGLAGNAATSERVSGGLDAADQLTGLPPAVGVELETIAADTRSVAGVASTLIARARGAHAALEADQPSYGPLATAALNDAELLEEDLDSHGARLGAIAVEHVDAPQDPAFASADALLEHAAVAWQGQKAELATLLTEKLHDGNPLGVDAPFDTK